MERPRCAACPRLKRHAPLLSLGVMAIVVLVSTAVVIGASRQSPDRDAGLIALASPSPRPSATPSMTPAPDPVHHARAGHADAGRDTGGGSPHPRAVTRNRRTSTARRGGRHGPDRHRGPGLLRDETDGRARRRSASCSVAIGRGRVLDQDRRHRREVLQLQTYDLDQSDCSLTQSYEPDDPRARPGPWRSSRSPSRRSRWPTAGIRSSRRAEHAGELTATVVAIARDGKPEACRDFEFVRGEISVSSYEELTAGIVGTWKGCVTTPWTPMYEVTVTLREDGTYSATSDRGPRWHRHDRHVLRLRRGRSREAVRDQRLPGQPTRGRSDRRRRLGSEPGVRDELRNVRLMGDQLEFELFHMDDYGPVTFQLYRQ